VVLLLVCGAECNAQLPQLVPGPERRLCLISRPLGAPTRRSGPDADNYAVRCLLLSHGPPSVSGRHLVSGRHPIADSSSRSAGCPLPGRFVRYAHISSVQPCEPGNASTGGPSIPNAPQHQHSQPPNEQPHSPVHALPCSSVSVLIGRSDGEPEGSLEETPLVVIGAEFGNQIVQCVEHPGGSRDQEIAVRWPAPQALNPCTRFGRNESSGGVVPQVQATFEVAV
jgi:hypothetical protein